MLRFGFPLLARMRSLRGGPLDLFAHSEDRRLERRLLADYGAVLDRIVAGLTAERLPLAVEIASLPDEIRGYGHVKARQPKRPRQGRRSFGRSGMLRLPPPRWRGTGFEAAKAGESEAVG